MKSIKRINDNGRLLLQGFVFIALLAIVIVFAGNSNAIFPDAPPHTSIPHGSSHAAPPAITPGTTVQLPSTTATTMHNRTAITEQHTIAPIPKQQPPVIITVAPPKSVTTTTPTVPVTTTVPPPTTTRGLLNPILCNPLLPLLC